MKRSFLLLCATALVFGANVMAQTAEPETGSNTNSTPGKDKIYPSIGTIERVTPLSTS
jgi:hypothetical protein